MQVSRKVLDFSLWWMNVLGATTLTVSSFHYNSLVLAQPITTSPDGTGTVVNFDGNQFNITGGSFSGDGRNLFHSFQQFGLDANQVANFFSNPQVNNILGRVVGGNPSIINGLIQVTGGNSNLFLMNPAGIVFGANARLDVPGSFTATTADAIGFEGGWLQAFGENEYQSLVGSPTGLTFSNGQMGVIINEGDLKAANLNLVAGEVINTGNLSTPAGNIILTAVPGSSKIKISQPGQLLTLEIDPPRDKQGNILPLTATDLPSLLTGAGIETGLRVNNGGIVELKSTGTEIPSQTGTVIVSGNLTTASGSSKGGDISVFGDRIGIIEGNLNASGATGGGEILIGGEYKGEGAVPKADVTYISRDSTITSDATGRGDGGKIIVWSEETSRIYGDISATGGVNGGDGGFVETSSKGYLDVTGNPDVSATLGKGGTWLIDPRNIEIVAGGDDASVGFGGIPIDAPFTPVSDDSQLTIGDLLAALQGGNNVVVTTGTTGTQKGNITLNTDFDFNGIDNGTLTLEAAGDILIGTGGNIFDSDGVNDVLNLSFTASNTDNLNNGITIQSSIVTGGGDINFTGRGANKRGIFLELSSSIDSGGGNITFTGTTNVQQGIVIQGTVASGGGKITFEGNSFNEDGIFLGNQITSAGGNITFTGNSTNNNGIQVDGLLDAGNGTINLTGSTTKSEGILVRDSVVFTGSNISLDGTSDAASGISLGEALTADITINSTGGQINLNGTSTSAAGITVTAQQVTINPNGGQVNFDGTGNPSAGGVSIESVVNFINGKANLTGSTSSGENQVVLSSTIDIGNAEVTINGDSINLAPGGSNPAITGTGTLNLQPIDSTLALEVGGTGLATQTFLNNEELSTLGNTLADVFIGRVDSSGTISLVSDINFNAPVTLRTLSSIQGTGFTLGNNGKKISLDAGQNINIGNLITSGSGSAINGGDVILNAGGNIDTGYINTQGTDNGGQIDITTSQFFQATGIFSDRNGINATISSAGSTQGGNIIIRHGGGVTTPVTAFSVGNISVNGTQAGITSGTSTITPTQSFTTDYVEGNIEILNGIRQTTTPVSGLVVSPPTPNLDNILIPPEEKTTIIKGFPEETNASLLDQENHILKTNLIELEPIEKSITTIFTKYLEIPEISPLNLQKAQNTLVYIEAQTGVKPALIYAIFTPTSPGNAAGVKDYGLKQKISKVNPEQSGKVIWQFDGQQIFTTSQEPSNSLQQTSQDDYQLELILVTGEGEALRHVVAGTNKAEILKQMKRFRRAVTNPSREAYIKPGQQFYQWLVAPLEADLQQRQIDNLVFILDEGIRSIPLAAMMDSHQFIVEKYSIGLMPSLSLTDTRYVNVKDLKVFAMGADTFQEQSSLPAVPQEVSLISQELWSGSSYLNQQFTLKNLKQARSLTPYGIIHLATHGEFNSGNPSNSYIQLWDEKLSLDKLRNLGWNSPPVELLVLSACRTALGSREAELGFAGFAVQAGVKSALGSLWTVADEGTLGLMSIFYQQLRTAPIKAEALRQAQLSMLQGKVYLEYGQLISGEYKTPLPEALADLGDQDLSHPYYWSGFTMIGNPW